MNGVERVKGRCSGKPVVEGTRLTTATVLSFFLAGVPLDDIAKEYPFVTKVQIEAALRFECCRACPCKDCRWARELPVT